MSMKWVEWVILMSLMAGVFINLCLVAYLLGILYVFPLAFGAGGGVLIRRRCILPCLGSLLRRCYQFICIRRNTSLRPLLCCMGGGFV